ncbi:hypothetical protein FH039_02745 [Thermococcus indicus]|uniref:Uncharacterized protein n=1 Tax=Thermococcus indicus TaxID=2586643 RepID=A0A4Y5SIU4_9EURY|nr:hypothetical protein [Thermococcus indicus]QDA30743.1 hypothetical protein FH039_02745 [Thermococcus indicus]
MARDLQDAMKWNIFLQLLTHIPALSGPNNISSIHLGKNNAKVLEKFVEEIVFAKHREYATDKLRENDIGGILIGFDELKRNPELRRKLAKEFVRAHYDLLTLEAKKRMEEAVDKALAAAEKIAEMKTPYFDEFGKRKFKPVFESPEDIYKIPELVEFLRLVEEVIPKNLLKEPLSKPPSELGKMVEPVEWDKVVDGDFFENGGSLGKEATRLLGIVQGLKLLNAGYEELKRVEEDLWKRIEEAEDLQLAGLYARVIAYLRRKDLEGAERFLSGITEG